MNNSQILAMCENGTISATEAIAILAANDTIIDCRRNEIIEGLAEKIKRLFSSYEPLTNKAA